MTISELSNLNNSEYGRVALATLIGESKLFSWLEQNRAFKKAATEDDRRPVNATTSIQTRDEGEGYTLTAVTPENKVNTRLYYHGGGVKVDDTRLDDAKQGLLDIRQYLDERIPAEFLAFVEGLEEMAFNGTGTGDPTEMKGLTAYLDGVTDIPGYTGEKGVIDAKDYAPAGAGSLDLTDPDQYPNYMKMMRLILAQVPNANGILMSPLTYAINCAIADSYHALAETRDNYGNIVKTFQGVPMLPMLDGSILHTEEDDDEAAATTSIYIARAGEQFLTILTNSGVTWKPFDLSPANLNSGAEKWEVKIAWDFLTKKCIRRIRNIKVTE